MQPESVLWDQLLSAKLYATQCYLTLNFLCWFYLEMKPLRCTILLLQNIDLEPSYSIFG